MQELARDQIPPCLNPPLANLWYILVEINEFDYREMAVLGCFLRSAPALKKLIFDLPYIYDEEQCTWFLKTLFLSEESLNPGEDLSELISALPFEIVFI
jgi:hypothetical protein